MQIIQSVGHMAAHGLFNHVTLLHEDMSHQSPGKFKRKQFQISYLRFKLQSNDLEIENNFNKSHTPNESSKNKTETKST